MLPPLKLKVLLISLGVMLMTSVKGKSCSQDQDLSWVDKLNRHADSLSKANSTAPLAQTIVQNALRGASESKTCSQAKALVRHGEMGIRQTLKSNDPAIPKGGDATGVNDAFPYPKLLVFVSFSIPAESLKTLSSQVSRVGGKLVLRGLVQGSFQQTAQKLQELQLDMMIDPTLFETYQINHSPTFILRSASTEKAEEDVNHDRMTGNVSLDYVLEQFSVSGDTQHNALQMLKILRRER